MTSKLVIGTLLVSVVVAGCAASSAPSSPLTSPTADPFGSLVPDAAIGTPAPSDPAPPKQAPTPDVTSSLGPDVLAEVVTTDLVMRTEPGVEAPSAILDYALLPGDLIYIIDGPVHATFYDWYHVQPITAAEPVGTGWAPAGWVAQASRQGEPWIAPRLTSCPGGGDVETAELAELHPLEALACFGDRSLRVRASAMICPGYVSNTPAIPNYTIEPTWLGLGQGCALHTADHRTVYGAAAPYFAPGVQSEVSPGWMWLIGRFDHPDAASCVLHEQPGDPLMLPAPNLSDVQVVLLCRSHFAVTAAAVASPPDE